MQPDAQFPTPVLVVGPSDWRSDAVAALEPADVRTATDREDALEALEAVGSAVVRVDGAPETTACAALRDRRPSMPIVACADDVTGPVARETTAAGATATLPTDDVAARPDVLAAASDAPDGGERVDADRLFDATFEDDALRWVLDAAGRIVRTNRTAAAAVGADPASLAGDPWWEGPWWTAGDGQELRARVRRASESSDPATLETTAFVAPDARSPVEVRVRPAGEDRFLASAIDVGERAELAERLRRSEELHRVTLNNMTDTVLVTDDEGRFTYVCPNVHFIFGYTVDEIEAMGTIDELLGEDLYDPADLAERGVLTNLECTTTDRAGEEHTLLVNVKSVSIQDGTTLYSCRDVTTRKQRERALSALHRTANDLAYAETDREIARTVVDDATDVLPTSAVALYRYDRVENRLRPVERSTAMRREYGPLEPLEPGDADVGRAFLDDEVRTSTRFGTDDGDGLCVPLGDHGVFVAGTADGIDGVTREVAELVATTARAAFDRVAREADLRDRDRRLSEQNRKLERANRINDLIREVDRAVVRAETREEIEDAVCRRLVGADRFALAWIGEHAAAGDVVQPRTWAGTDRGYLDRAFGDDVDSREPSVRAATSNTPCAVVNVAEAPRAAPWRKAALASGLQSVVSVPLLADDARHGTLSVYATDADAFDDVTRTVLGELGRTVGSAISAAARKDALLGDPGTELEYEVADPDGRFGRLARRADCRLALDDVIHREDRVLAFVTVAGAEPARVVEAAADDAEIDGARVVNDGDDGGVVRLRFRSPFLATALADHGAELHDLAVDDDGMRLVIAVSASIATRTVDGVVTDRYPDARLRAQRERPAADRDSPSFREQLTSRQLEVVQTAYYAGYFDSPRATKGAAVAETLDISPQAFYEHVRAVQRRLLDAAFDADAGGV